MSGTCLTDLNAITLTASAKAAASVKGVDIAALVALAKTHTIELASLLRAIVSVHPTSGGDATNLASLNTIISELA
jgi:hypothetical protein